MTKKAIFLMAIAIFIVGGFFVIIPRSQSDNGDQTPMSPIKMKPEEKEVIKKEAIEVKKEFVVSDPIMSTERGRKIVGRLAPSDLLPLLAKSETEK